MITVYEVIADSHIDHESSENSQQVVRAETAPRLGDMVCMGSARQWQVVELQTYSNASQSITLALVHPAAEPVPDRSDWDQTKWRDDYPGISLNLKLMPNGDVQYYGSNMEGNPPVGRLYGGEPTEHPTLLNPVPLAWMIDAVETYQPSGNHSYTAIHACYALPCALPTLAEVA